MACFTKRQMPNSISTNRKYRKLGLDRNQTVTFAGYTNIYKKKSEEAS